MDGAANSTRKVDKAAQSTTREVNGLSTAMAAAGAIAGVAVVKGLASAVTAASNLNETVSKTGVVFGDASDSVYAYAETSAESIGMSERAALDAASTFGVFGKAAGLAGQDLAAFSTDLTTLAADFASFYNASPEESIMAIGAALRGEAEPIRRFGVLLDDATLRNRALQMGLIDSVKQGLTPQQKALAAQAEILAQSSVAQGDFQRTSEGLANQQRILAANFENTQAAIGEAFLPSVNRAVSGLNSLMERFTALDPSMQQTIVQAGILIPLLLLAGNRAQVAGTKLLAMDAAARRAAAGQAVLAGSLTGLAVLGSVMLTTWSEMSAVTDAATESVDAFQRSASKVNFDTAQSEVDALGQSIKDIGNFDSIGDYWSAGIDALFSGFDTQAEQYVRRQAEMAAAEKQRNEVIQRTIALTGLSEQAVRELADAQGVDLTKGTAAATFELSRAASAQAQVATSADQATEAEEALNSEFGVSNEVLKEYHDALEKADRGQQDLFDSTTALGEAQAAANALVKEGAKGLSENTDAGRKNRDALSNLATAAKDHSNAVFDGNVATKGQIEAQRLAREDLAKSREAFIDTARKMGASKTAAEALADAMGLVPEVVATDVKVRLQMWGYDKFMGAVNALNDLEKQGKITVSNNAFLGPLAAQLSVGAARTKPRGRGGGGGGGGGGGRGRAVGGPVVAGMEYLVGEYGPERLRLNPSGTSGWVTPTPVGATATAGSSVTLSLSVDARGATDPVAVEAAARRGGEAALRALRQELGAM
jgi:hypothetical protein